jgi:hypothetical protein
MRALLLYELALAILLQNQQVPTIDYSYLPTLPDEHQTLEAASEAANAAALASTEAYSAAAEQKSAESAAAGAAAALKSFKARAATEAKVEEAKETARKISKIREETEAAALAARQVAEGIPDRVQAAAAKAAAEVIAEAKKGLKDEAKAAVEQIKAEDKALQESAVKAVAEAGAPYCAAEIRLEKLGRDDVVQARDFANAVGPIKMEAMKTMGVANQYQGEGKVVTAQQMALKAHDLMDKAMQMQGHAQSLAGHANKMQSSMGIYPLAAKQAEDYAAYQANPVGDSLSIPPLPAELQL